MRLVWTLDQSPRPFLGYKDKRLRYEGPHIGPRMRLPQAKDVPEAVILEVLNRRPGEWHDHWGMQKLSLDLAAFPAKVVWAKLCSMSRRGLVHGGGNYDSRCDWHTVDPMDVGKWERCSCGTLIKG